MAYNPLYVLLPVLEEKRERTTESKGKFLSLEDLLYSEAFPDLQLLEQLTTLDASLSKICDIQGEGFIH